MASISFSGTNYGLQIGVHNGPVNMPSERPETPTNPLSTVPFARDRHFVSRDALLRQIREESLVSGSRIALIGLGGVGKSQLAIEYSYEVRSQSPTTWVFWVHASNQARFEQSFRDIADQVKIRGRQDPEVNIFKLVENWLQDEKRKWVCILDNVDDDQLLRSFTAPEKGDSTRSQTNAAKPLLEYIPRSPNGYVIITSRSREVALKMVDHKGLIEVEPMENSESLELLRRTLELPTENQACQQLVNALEFMPLAIVQAASYIRNRAPRYSVSQYLKDFQKNDREAIKLLKKEAGHTHRDWEAKNSILVTWQMSFDYIRQRYPSAADLLSLMSFFDRQGIPESLIRHQPASSELQSDSSDGDTSESDTSPDFEDDVITLRDYSFISISEDTTSFTMHRLVQLTTRAWLKSHGQLDQWKDKFISTLYDEFPSTGEYENWERCRPLFPHVKSAMSQRPTSPEYQEQWATLLYRGAWYASEIGNLMDTREMALKSRDQRMILLSDKHEDVIDSTTLLANAYWLEGRWEEAKQIEVQMVETSKAHFGEDHPYTLTCMANLALTFRDQGRWEEAEQLQVQAVKSRKTTLGMDHPDTLSGIANLAAIYGSQGRWEEAEQLMVQVMETYKTKLGNDHPDTLLSIGNLAAIYGDQGRWEEAEQLEVQVMETRRTNLGEKHPDTILSMANLAVTYGDQGRWEEAEQLEVQVMETRKMNLGEDHPDTLTSIGRLATVYWSQDRWEEAEPLEIQVMETRKTKLGENHPDTLSSMANLASTWKCLGHEANAINLLRTCVARQKQTIGLDHPDTVSSSKRLLNWETEDLNMSLSQLDA
ncbi:Tetratricopeptide-like helical [Penicillium concentricum]|uniref:Tetratricopeptide-like helical n=1 Tax=Penicillium concentricum TaxID=293559 RepID=A0A9W9V8D1_9EURO|nr:Tetratricopeptide-like helical [Penicillium concentricum]KAJ5372537.1 Tetratricopeptide-like helical [Penicillium concentricum]